MDGIYRDLAPFYDAMNSGIDYEAWADQIDIAFRKCLTRPVGCILDIGCGTGSMTIPLAKRGYDVVGLDLNAEMLTVACERAEKAGVSQRIQWTQQDMCDFTLWGQVDAVVCTLDGLNHLKTPAALTECFRHVATYLAEDGVFLFDLNSKYQFEHVYGDQVYTMETDRAYCVWQNDYRERSKLCDFWITLFIRDEDGKYIRRESCETERFYPLTTLKKCLGAAGLSLAGVYGDLYGTPSKETDTRWYCIARRQEQSGEGANS